MSGMDFFNRYPPYIQTLALMLISAIVVFALEEGTRPVPPSAPPFVQPAEVPVTHIFTQQDYDVAARLSEDARKLLQDIDSNISERHTVGEVVCLNGLRSGAFAFTNTAFADMRHYIMLSLAMQDARDEYYINDAIAHFIDADLKQVPVMNSNVNAMYAGCPSSPNVTARAQEVKLMLGQLAVMLQKSQAKIAAAPKQ